MTTDLFVFGGPAPVPPECRREPAPLPPWTPVAEDTATLELPPLAARAPAGQILPSLSLLTDRAYSFQFEASRDTASGWSALSPVGPHDLGGVRPADPGLRADVDVYTATPPVDSVRIRLTVRSPDLDALTRAPALVAVSLAAGPSPDEGTASGRIALAVPPLSQMDAPAAIRRRICSPTCVAMVLGYWRRPAAPAEVAQETYEIRHDLYGVWPAAIRAAARRGVAGYLLRFPSWSAAAWCFDQGLPVIGSVRYAAGELAGAAIEATAGHLLVLTGYDGDDVLANDPAAPTAREVPRRYARADLTRVWLERTGVGYVFFEPGGRG